MNRQEIIDNWKKFKKEDDEIIQKESENVYKEITNKKLKHIDDLKNQFLSEINFYQIKLIRLIRTSSFLILRDNPEDSIYDDIVEYEIENKDNKTTCIKKTYKFVFEILYTKPHYIEFIDDIKIIHFL